MTDKERIFRWAASLLCVGGLIWFWIHANDANERSRLDRQTELSMRPKVINHAFCAKQLKVFDQLNSILSSGNFKLISDLYESGDLLPVEATRALDYRSHFGKWVKVSSFEVDGNSRWLDECWIDGRVLDKRFGKVESDGAYSSNALTRKLTVKLGPRPVALEGTQSEMLAELKKAVSDFALLADADQLRIVTYIRMNIDELSQCGPNGC